MNESVPRAPSQAVRWLALGAAGGAALAVGMETWGFTGPWQSIALVLALLAVFATTAFLFSARRRDKAWLQIDERARRGEETVDALQREIDRHTQLEQELIQDSRVLRSAQWADRRPRASRSAALPEGLECVLGVDHRLRRDLVRREGTQGRLLRRVGVFGTFVRDPGQQLLRLIAMLSEVDDRLVRRIVRSSDECSGADRADHEGGGGRGDGERADAWQCKTMHWILPIPPLKCGLRLRRTIEPRLAGRTAA